MNGHPRCWNPTVRPKQRSSTTQARVQPCAVRGGFTRSLVVRWRLHSCLQPPCRLWEVIPVLLPQRGSLVSAHGGFAIGPGCVCQPGGVPRTWALYQQGSEPAAAVGAPPAVDDAPAVAEERGGDHPQADLTGRKQVPRVPVRPGCAPCSGRSRASTACARPVMTPGWRVRGLAVPRERRTALTLCPAYDDVASDRQCDCRGDRRPACAVGPTCWLGSSSGSAYVGPATTALGIRHPT